MNVSSVTFIPLLRNTRDEPCKKGGREPISHLHLHTYSIFQSLPHSQKHTPLILKSVEREPAGKRSSSVQLLYSGAEALWEDVVQRLRSSETPERCHWWRSRKDWIREWLCFFFHGGGTPGFACHSALGSCLQCLWHIPPVLSQSHRSRNGASFFS